MNFSSARQYFYQEIHQPDEHINLAKAALYIAQEEYPDLDPEEYLNAFDTMASEVQERLPSSRYPLRLIQSLNQYLYDDLGFAGNKTDYYDPRNSFLNDTIDRRLGIPITLALVYLEVADRIDFPMVGIGMPGHFLIRPDIPDVEIFVDAYNRGEVMFAQDCQERLAQMFQQPVSLQPEYLAPVSNRQFLARMLTNLKYIYLKQQHLEKTLAAVERILLLFPGVSLEVRDRGLLYYQLGHYPQAVEDLQTYLAKVPDAEDAIVIRRLLADLGK
ncbi:SirB1 family protein [Nostocaceae cyanobacterium CENA369]|uniref:SirB1 family protein n=1 Tax=Dendronalium phyllosphericum CENA369 TaxID=1725256 RepID=A0A8J7I545_9NOST|nr:SirB1 family protein [Dendronalium phyllosphericum]MBH8575986.1 SirB1 family protein [Dendronalium phyllosphericum CENA369]